MAAAVGHDQPLRIRPAQLLDRGPDLAAGRDGRHLLGAAAAGAVVAGDSGDRSRRRGLAGDDPVVPADPQDLPLPIAAGATAAGDRVVLYGGDGVLGGAVLAWARWFLERSLSGSRRTLVPL